MYQHHLSVVFALAQPSIQRHAVNPFCQVGLVNTSAYHSFEIDDEVKGHSVNIIGIDDDDIFTPVCFRQCIIIHTCKDTTKG